MSLIRSRALLAATSGVLDAVAIERIEEAEQILLHSMADMEAIAEALESGAQLTTDDRAEMIQSFEAALVQAV